MPPSGRFTPTVWAELLAARSPGGPDTAPAVVGAYPAAATISHSAPTRNTRVTGTLCPPGQPVAGAQEEHMAARKSNRLPSAPSADLAVRGGALGDLPPERQRPAARG